MPDSISRDDVSPAAFIREGRGLARFFNGRSPGVRQGDAAVGFLLDRRRGLDQCEFRVPGPTDERGTPDTGEPREARSKSMRTGI